MEKAAVFKCNRSQAVRMPKSLALPENVTRVDVIALGRARLITLVGEAWDSWFDGQSVTADFMSEREQPKEQEREAFLCLSTCLATISACLPFNMYQSLE